jgi:predicted Fe-S protein YdhL (DUF1289 family)
MPPSPCISHCVMSPQTGLCEGCLRTLSEIIDWSRASDDRKRAIWLAIGERRAQLDDRQGSSPESGSGSGSASSRGKDRT